MAEVSKNNLEAERLRLKGLEVMQRGKNLEKSSDESKIDFKKRKLDASTDSLRVNNLEEQNKINQSVKFFKEKLENEFINTKINIKRDYKLTQKSNFDLWIDYLRSDLMSNDLLDVIDSKNKDPENLSANIIAKRKNIVRDIIINHLDENYHKKILNKNDPKEILKKLRGCRKSEVNVTHSSVRTRLYQIKMKKDEKVDDFCERFDSIIREYEACEDTVPLTDQEKRSSFYQAVASVVPEL